MASHMINISCSGNALDKYPAKQHAQKSVSLLGVSEGLIYLQGQRDIYMEDSDMTYPFRQRRYFYYLSGVNEANCHLLYDIASDHSTLYVPHASPEQIVYYGRGSTVNEAKEKYDFDEVRWTSQLAPDVDKYASRYSHPIIYIAHHSQVPPASMGSKPLLNAKFDAISLRPALDSARITKTHSELRIMKKANDISSLAHRTVLHHSTSLRSEAALEAIFLAVCMTHKASVQAYDPIVAAGTNASILHYSADDASLSGRPLVCMDAGGEYECYASDITRSFPLSADGTWPSADAAALYALVEEMQESCIAALAPGVLYSDINRLAQRIGTRGLIRLGVIKIPDEPNAVEEFIDRGDIRAFFPHFLGHHMGLDVHDIGPIGTVSATTPAIPTANAEHDRSLSSDPPRPQSKSQGHCRLAPIATVTCRSTPLVSPPQHPLPSRRIGPIPIPSVTTTPEAPLEVGMVLTVEPGIYFNRYALEHLYLNRPEFAALVDMDVLERFIALGGVRIEDDLLITPTGYETLTTAPKGKEAQRVIREGSRCDHGKGCPFPIEGRPA